jgi:hypothetical protein
MKHSMLELLEADNQPVEATLPGAARKNEFNTKMQPGITYIGNWIVQL